MKLSIIIPTWNEQRRLESTVAHLRSTAGQGSIEIIIADGGSADGTQATAKRVADVLVDSPRGRAVQMNAGALVATGDFLLFLHADTVLPDGWLGALFDTWSQKPSPGATAYSLAFDSPKPIYSFIAALGDWRSRLTGVPHGDQAIACRREDYRRVGGFPPVALMEEYFLLPKLSHLGPIVVMKEAVSTSTRRYERNGPIFNALRNATLIALFKAGVSPARLAGLYR